MKVLRRILSSANRSFVYVNSMNCIFICGSGCSGGLLLYRIPCTQSIPSLKRALHWHLCESEDHGKSQDGMVFSGGTFIDFPAFMMV